MVLLSSGTAAGVPEVKMNPNCLSHLPVASCGKETCFEGSPMYGLQNAPGDVLSCFIESLYFLVLIRPG